MFRLLILTWKRLSRVLSSWFLSSVWVQMFGSERFRTQSRLFGRDLSGVC